MAVRRLNSVSVKRCVGCATSTSITCRARSAERAGRGIEVLRRLTLRRSRVVVIGTLQITIRYCKCPWDVAKAAQIGDRHEARPPLRVPAQGRALRPALPPRSEAGR